VTLARPAKALDGQGFFVENPADLDYGEMQRRVRPDAHLTSFRVSRFAELLVN
jgi:hypothetical protein